MSIFLPKSSPRGVVCDCRLESLPPEVRRHLLSHLDLSRLKAIVLASPIFYQQYLIDRTYILSQAIQATLGSGIVDAYAVHVFRAKAEGPQDIAQSLQLYSKTFSWNRLPLSANLARNEALSLAGFYFRSIQPLIQPFLRWLNDGFVKERASNCSHNINDGISVTEMMRVLRSMYRFELLCQVSDVAETGRRSSQEHDIETFLGLLEPWEVEELFSFYQFAESVHDKALSDVSQDLHPDHPRFDDQVRPPTPDGAFELDSEWTRQNCREGITLRGLPFLSTILFHPKDHEQLVLTMQSNMLSSYIPLNTYEGILGESHQYLRRQYSPSERDKMQDRRDPLVLGDGGLNYPPSSWAIIWRGSYSNLYGYYTSDEMRRWGYVFWDAETIERVGGKAILERQWMQSWDLPLGEYDPRDGMVSEET